MSTTVMRRSRLAYGLALLAPLGLLACQPEAIGKTPGSSAAVTDSTDSGDVAAAPQPKAVLTPQELVLPSVAMGKAPPSQSFQLTNAGFAPLELDRLAFFGDAGFTLPIKEFTRVVEHRPDTSLLLQVVLQPGESIAFQVGFKAVNGAQATATIRLHTNDPAAQAGLEVKLVGQPPKPCLAAVPDGIVFSAVLLGETAKESAVLWNCGFADVEVYGVALAAGTNMTKFGLTWVTPPPGGAAATGPTPSNPFVLPSGHEVAFAVKYTPTDASAAPDHTTVEVQSSEQDALTIAVKGYGVTSLCPTAIAEVKEGPEVVPGTVLHLRGDASKAVGAGTIQKYKWTVQKQPVGSNVTLLPSTTVANPGLVAELVGEYVFCLDVWDAQGNPSCAPSCITAWVLPEALHVELSWTTPGDADPTDTGQDASADLDLHVAHPQATGPDLDCDGLDDPWFHNPFDAFWFNPTPNWGSQDPAVDDDPSLIEPPGTVGLETLDIPQPEGVAGAPVPYRLAVHDWDDNGYGPSVATLKVWVQGVEALAVTNVALTAADMWYVGKLNWPNTLTGGNLPVVDVCYQNGNACLGKTEPGNPAGGKMWQASGAWCVTPCYDNKNFMSQAGGTMPAKCQAP